MTNILDISDIPLKWLFDGIPWGKNKDTCSDRLIYTYIYIMRRYLQEMSLVKMEHPWAPRVPKYHQLSYDFNKENCLVVDLPL